MIQNQKEVVFSGFGGQGVMFVGQLLAYAAMEEGLQVTWIPSYGPEMRGGTAHCIVTISTSRIGSPIIKHPGTAVVFNNPSYDKYEPLVAPRGLLVVNRSLVEYLSERTDIDRLYIPATQMAHELGNQKTANLILLGAMLQWNNIIPVEMVVRALEIHIPAHHRELLPLNLEALELGAQYALDVATSV